MELESPESPKESPESPKESPESPTESPEIEEILFVEDRRPGNVPPINLNQRENKSKVEIVQEAENFICLNSGNNKTDKNNKSDEAVSRKSRESANNETESIQQLSENLLFVIEDRNPLLTGQENQSPRYNINKSFLNLQDDKESTKKSKFRSTCWNCGDTSHALRDCKEPRNHLQIAKCRKEFQDSKGSMPVYKRYHVEDNQRFAHLVPGQLSKELRQALGLDARELPSHIYLMRRLGYPPGWLQEALVSHSGISMFDGHGKEVADPGTELGEVVEQGSLDKYDVNKVIHYPGFNVPPPPDTYDDSKYWRCPPMSQCQSVEVMLEKLSGRVVGGYKRKKLARDATTPDPAESSQSVESLDMEYEETPEPTELPEDNCKFVPPLPDEELPPPPPSELPVVTDTDSQPLLSTFIEETSLTELEEQKKLLLAQLNDVKPVCGTPESKIGKIKSVDFGTPILKSVSPYARLPSAEKFSVNICDVINFENLPDSTGKYEKISGIIRKVRCKLSKINNDI